MEDEEKEVLRKAMSIMGKRLAKVNKRDYSAMGKKGLAKRQASWEEKEINRKKTQLNKLPPLTGSVFQHHHPSHTSVSITLLIETQP